MGKYNFTDSLKGTIDWANKNDYNFKYPFKFSYRFGQMMNFGGTLFQLNQMPPPIDIKFPNVAELKEQIKKEIFTQLKKELSEQQIIPIQFLEKLHLRQPIAVSLSYSLEDKIWVVDCPELNLYGEGEDEQRAIDDFKNALEEFYFSLKRDKEKLGPELKKRWELLQKIIEEK
jgi:predicted RNase H-like HicB family nuclease